MTDTGASNNERLLAAARQDNEDLLLEVFEQGNFDINHQDSLGNTALHYAVQQGSTDVLEHILSHNDCDVDPVNRLEKATPLHLAVYIKEAELRQHVIETLLEAGADTTIKDKNGDTISDLLRPDDKELLDMIRKSKAQASVSKSDIVDEDDDDDDGEGSGSGSDSD